MSVETPIGDDKSNPEAPQAASGFYVINTFRKTADQLAIKAGHNYQRFIREPLRAGIEFADDVRKEPLKTLGDKVTQGRRSVDAMLLSGRERVSEASRNPRKAVDDAVDKGFMFAHRIKADANQTVRSIREGGRQVSVGLEQDGRRLFDEMSRRGRRLKQRLPLIQRIEQKVTTELQKVPSALNLPTRDEIQRLEKNIEKLESRISAITREQQDTDSPPKAP